MNKSELKEIIKECIYEKATGYELDDGEVITEKALFVSPQAKSMKKHLKESLKKYRKEITGGGFGSNFKFKGYSAAQSSAFAKKMARDLKFETCFISNTYITRREYTYSTGYSYVTVIYYTLDTLISATKGNYVYNIECAFDKSDANACFYFDEKSISNFVYPKDVVEFALKKNSPNYAIGFSKNAIGSDSKMKGAKGYNEALYQDIINYCNSKYPGKYGFETSKILKKLKIKKL